MRKRMRRRKWSGTRLSRSCAKRAMVVKRKWLRHKENVHRVGARPELVPSVLCTCAPIRLLEDVVASKDSRYFLFGLFFAVFLESMESTVGHRMAWLDGVQALRRAAGQRSGPSQAAGTVGSAGWRGGGPWTGWNAAGIGAMRSRLRSAAGDRRSRLESERCWQAWARDQERWRIDA